MMSFITYIFQLNLKMAYIGWLTIYGCETIGGGKGSISFVSKVSRSGLCQSDSERIKGASVNIAPPAGGHVKIFAITKIQALPPELS